jgi:protein-S-isoprenylcysteine O-methyltransferase Ste14
VHVSRRQHRAGTALVVAQFGLILLCLLPLGPVIGPGLLRPAGVACLVLAAAVGGWALISMGADTRVHPVPDPQADLRMSGIYAWIRHPMYTAVLLSCLGVTLITGRVLSLLALVALLVVLHVKGRFEDGLLSARFGDQHREYAARVPAMVPQPWRSREH